MIFSLQGVIYNCVYLCFLGLFMALRTGSRSCHQCMIYMIQYGIDGIETVTNPPSILYNIE